MVFLGTFLLRILSLAGPPISTPTASNYEFTHKRIIRLWCGEVYVDPTHALSSLELSHMTILCSSESQRFDARYWMLGAGALGRPRGMEWGGRRVQDGEHMYTCGGLILIFGKSNTVM